MTKNRSKKRITKESILQDRKECFLFRRIHDQEVTDRLEKHHIFAGKNRAASEKYGFWVWLSPIMHRDSTKAVHGRDGKEYDELLKAECQRKFEESHSREEFMSIIGRNYL